MELGSKQTSMDNTKSSPGERTLSEADVLRIRDAVYEKMIAQNFKPHSTNINGHTNGEVNER